MGHVGVAFENPDDGTWVAGAVEGPGGANNALGVNGPADNGGWVSDVGFFKSVTDVIREFGLPRTVRSNGIILHGAYDRMRVIYVKNSDYKDALSKIQKFPTRGYRAWTNNDCLNAVYDVLINYNVEGLSAPGWLEWPVKYFDQLLGDEIILGDFLRATNSAAVAGASNTGIQPQEPVTPSYQGSNALGEMVAVAASQGLNVRSEPGTNSQILVSETQGATGTIADGPIFQDNYWWWRVNFDDGTSGWSADNWLVQASEKQQVTLTIYVYDYDSNQVLPGAQITGQDGAGNSFQGDTNNDGYLTISGMPGSWSFTVSAPAYNTNSWSQVVTDDTIRQVELVSPGPTPQICSPYMSNCIPCGLSTQQKTALAATDPKDEAVRHNMKITYLSDIISQINTNQIALRTICLGDNYGRNHGCDKDILKEMPNGLVMNCQGIISDPTGYRCDASGCRNL